MVMLLHYLMPSQDQSSTRRCPSCGAEIAGLDYVADVTNYGWESGSCGFDGDDWDYGDSDTNNSEYGDTEYNCPVCHANIGLEDDWPERDEDEDEDDEEDAPPPPVAVDADEEPTASFYQKREVQNLMLYTCPDCQTVRWLSSDEKDDIGRYRSNKERNPKGSYRRPLVACDKCWVEHPVDTNNTIKY